MLLQPLQLVRCYVIDQLDRVDSKKKTISLSLRQSLVNKGIAFKHFSSGFPLYCCIVSKEDHGYI